MSRACHIYFNISVADIVFCLGVWVAIFEQFGGGGQRGQSRNRRTLDAKTGPRRVDIELLTNLSLTSTFGWVASVYFRMFPFFCHRVAIQAVLKDVLSK